ncbi:MAG: hypothetical protein IJB36_00185 [Clostridia bacterium]|nr:hypothetical protein [Clostridia bacterium]
MKKFSLLLCVLLILSLLCSCQQTAKKSDKKTSSSAGDTKITTGASDNRDNTSTTAGNNGDTEGKYLDVLEGLPYTMACKDYYSPGTDIEYTFTDEGRLNDGIYRSQAELENGTGEDKKVVLSDVRRYRVQITFEADGTQTGSCLVLQNCDSYYFHELEAGPDLDNLTVLDVEEDYDTPTGMHTTQLIRFDPIPIQTVRITLYVTSRSDIVLDEIAILSPTNGGDSWTTTTTTEPTKNDITTTVPTNTTSPTTPTNTTGTTGTRPTNNGSNSIVGRWTQHVEGDNVEMTALYSFFDDGTGSLITFGGLVTGELTYTYGENNRYTITIKAKLFGQEDSDTGSGYMYVEGDYLYVVTDEDETTVLRRMTDEECTLALELAEKVGVRF